MNACLFAARSYIAGDGGSLQPLSSCKFKFRQHLCEISLPISDVHNAVARANTVGLLYHISGELNVEALKKHEDE
jgi:hypothetical protein